MSITMVIEFTEHDAKPETYTATDGLDAYRWLYNICGELAQEFRVWPDSAQWIGPDMVAATLRELATCGVLCTIYNSAKPRALVYANECALLPALGLKPADLWRA